MSTMYRFTDAAGDVETFDGFAIAVRRANEECEREAVKVTVFKSVVVTEGNVSKLKRTVVYVAEPNVK